MINLYSRTFCVIAALLLVQTGCTPAVQTTAMAIDKTRYDPIVTHYPTSVGIYFPVDFYENNFYHETKDGHSDTFHNNPADATRRALGLAFEESFLEVRYLDDLQQGFAAGDLAFIIVPNIVAMNAVLDAEVMAVRIVYDFDFFKDGKHIHSFRVAGIDAVNRPFNEEARSPAISAEKFDEVARSAVWDATSVFLAEFSQQNILTDKLPPPVVKERAVTMSPQVVNGAATLAMVGPVPDQDQEPEKQQLEACLIEELKDNEQLQIVPLQSLREKLYPWLSLSNYPQLLSEMEMIIREPAVRKHLQELDIRYILYWDGETSRSQFEGPFYMTPYGFIGYESSDKTSMIRVEMLSVEDGRVVTSLESTRKGKDSMLGLVWFPLPLFEDTEEDACEEIARQVDDFIKVKTQN